MTRRALACVACGAVALLSAVDSASSKTRRLDPIAVRLAWARAAPAGVSAGYLTLRNNGAQTDRLMSAASPWVERVELQMTTTTGAVMRMRPVVGGLEIASARTLKFAPGGYHLMLIGLKRPLNPGDHLPITLQFEKAGPVRVSLIVGSPPPGGAD